jgi:hypothetical protein
MCQYVSEGLGGLARRESWLSESSDRRAERSVKRRARKGAGKVTEHMYTVSMALAVLVGFSVEVEWKTLMGDSK